MDLKNGLKSNIQWLLLSLAALFYLIGFLGIIVFPKLGLQNATPWHLLLMNLLLLLSFREEKKQFAVWAILVFLLGFVAEFVGVNYGWLFGGYHYSEALGVKAGGVPLLIACNWVMVFAGCASLISLLGASRRLLLFLAPVLATAQDLLLEPVSMHLGWWLWDGNVIPLFNYLSWAALHLLIALLWNRLQLKGNIFAAGLFIVQSVFFALILLFK